MDALLLAVLNALWQGAALIALVALALRAGLRRNATTACVVWSITFAVVALLPAIDLALARPANVAPAALTGTSAVTTSAGTAFRAVRGATVVAAAPAARADAALRNSAPLDVSAVETDDVALPALSPPAGAAIAALRGGVGDGAVRLGGVATAFVRVWGIVLVAAWALVAGALLLRLAAAYAAVARMKRGATPLDDPLILGRLRAAGHRRRATVAQSSLVEIPCAVGFVRPMILIPARLTSSLDADDLARVVLHESAHLQRYDDWTNALEQIVCAVQFFQPALYVARRSIDFEREVACDDRVLEDVGEPLRYAECLARIVQRHVRGRQAAVVPGFVLRRAQVVARVRRIVDRSRDASPHLRLGAAVLGGGVMVATLGMARLQVPVVSPAAASPAVAQVVPAVAVVPVSAVASKPAVPAIVPAVRTAAAKHPARIVPATHAVQAAHAVLAAHAAPAKKATRPVIVVAAVDPSPAPSASPSPAPSPSPYARSRRNVVAHEHVRVRTAHDSLDDTIEIADEVRAVARLAPGVADRVRIVVDNASSMSLVTAPVAVRAGVRTVAEAGAEAPRAPLVVTGARHSGGDLLDAIDEAKYPRPSVDDLIALRNQGVSGDYVRRMGALGRGRPALHELIALAVQGVTPEYVGTLDARLASHPTLDQVIALRVQGVSASWLDGLAQIGYPRLSATDAAALAVQGVSVSYVRGLLDAGMRGVTPQQLLVLRTQGVDGAFVRRLAAHNYHNLTTDELVRLKVSGFEP